jgi:hypothetical protein
MLAGGTNPAMPAVAVSDATTTKPGNEDHPEGVLEYRIGIRRQRRATNHGDPGVVVPVCRDIQEAGANQGVIIEKVEDVTPGLGRGTVTLAAGVASLGDKYLESIRSELHLGQPLQCLDIPPRLYRYDDGKPGHRSFTKKSRKTRLFFKMSRSAIVPTKPFALSLSKGERFSAI